MSLFRSSAFRQGVAGAISRLYASKATDFLGIGDVATLANADASGRMVIVPAGVYPVTASITLSGSYQFDKGAMLQPANGVTITFSNAYINASDYQQIFDLSKGGTLAGNLANDYHSGCWFGADYTGSTVTGPEVQAAFNSTVTPTVKLPRGTYNCTGTPLTLVDSHLMCAKFRSSGTGDAVILKWTADMGANTAALSLYSSTSKYNAVQYRGFKIVGPGQGSAAQGAVGCQMDGIIFGNGGNHQFDALDLQVSGVRFGYTAWCNNGHSTLNHVQGNGNYATWNMLNTGGDWTWTNCGSGGSLRATFYVPNNGTMGAHANIEGFYSYGDPYFVYQSNTNDARIASTVTAGLLSASQWNRAYCEGLGNAFINLTPTGSFWNQLKLISCGWDSFASSANPITSEAQDFAIKAGTITGLDLNDVNDWPGPGYLAPFNSGVIQVQSSTSRGISAGRVARLPNAGQTFLSGTTSARVVPQTYTLPSITIPAGSTSGSYAAADYEAVSRFNWFLRAATQTNLGAVTYTVTNSGSTVTITLSAALASNVTFSLNLYGPAL
jgi:hypothetical protein